MTSVVIPKRGLADVVHQLKEHKPGNNSASDEHPQDSPLSPTERFSTSPIHSPQTSSSEFGGFSRSSLSKQPRKSSASYRHPPPGTPSGRTGPPRSISYSYNYSISGKESFKNHSEHEDAGPSHLSLTSHEDSLPVDILDSPDFRPIQSPFRGALDYVEAGKEEDKGEEAEDKKGKKRERDSYFPETWKPFRWGESPKAEPAPYNDTTNPASSEPPQDGVLDSVAEINDEDAPKTAMLPPERKGSFIVPKALRRTKSLPQMKGDVTKGSPIPKWSRLKSLLPHIASQGRSAGGPQSESVVVPHSVNITDELITGGLSTLMLRLWFERDEKGQRRIPVLLHRLRIRVSDSLHPLHGSKAVFRIECEYANGAARWVVYRQLREFVSLHTHYTISNAYNRNVESLPDFPKTSKLLLAMRGSQRSQYECR